MSNNCPICGRVCEYAHLKELRGLTGINCDNGHHFYLPTTLIACGGEDPDSNMIRRYNIINEYLLTHGNHPIVEGKECDYIFYTKETQPKNAEESCFVDLDNEMQNYPKDFTDKMNRALLNLSIELPKYGSVFTSSEKFARSVFAELDETVEGIFKLLKELSYLTSENAISYKISASGWKQIAELKKSNNEINQGFIAMQFDSDTEIIRKIFKSSIKKCGFKFCIMDEKEHNNQIVPEMFFEIKRSKFMVVDITYPNYGAYYEAGYAQALGKEVIICCRKAEFNSPERKTKPHFDIAQKSAVVWETDNELKRKLTKRINATVTK